MKKILITAAAAALIGPFPTILAASAQASPCSGPDASPQYCRNCHITAAQNPYFPDSACGAGGGEVNNGQAYVDGKPAPPPQVAQNDQQIPRDPYQNPKQGDEQPNGVPYDRPGGTPYQPIGPSKAKDPNELQIPG